MDRARLLIVDVDPVIRTSLARYLALRGYEAIAVGSAAEALELLRSPGVDAVLDGLPLASAGAGWRLLCTGRELDPTLVLIVMVTYSDMACAVEAMREGAFCFLEKPFDAADMEVHLVKALEHRRLQREVAGLRAQLQQAARSVAAELAPPRGAGPAEPSPPPAPPAPSAQDPLPLDVASLPLALPEQGIMLKDLLERIEGQLIEQAMARASGNRNQAARLLGLKRTTLVEKLRRRGWEGEGGAEE